MSLIINSLSPKLSLTGTGCFFLLWIRIAIILLFITIQVNAQKEDLSCVWPAKWIAAADSPWKEYSVHKFRRSFEIKEVPDKLIIHTSGDNRYRLYLNGNFITWGPQLGDLDHWHYETTDISAYLKKGENILAVEVLNYGSHPPDALQSVQTAFLLCADDKKFRSLNSGENWKAIYDPSYSPNIVNRQQVHGYYGGGSRENVDGRLYLRDWNLPGYDDSNWKTPAVIENAFAKTCKWASRWKLTPRTLPHEILKVREFESIRDASGVIGTEGFLEGDSILTIPAHTRARIIFDHGFETTAYPVLKYNNGEDAVITIRYVEAPVIGNIKNRKKGNRNEIDGKNFYGYFDRIIVGNDPVRVLEKNAHPQLLNNVYQDVKAYFNPDRVYLSYTPFWWRAFRYIELSIETKNEALEIHSFNSISSTYPFETRSSFYTDSPENAKYQKILEIGERTVRCCAHESFMDCPYYEESQFEGDTRVQALISYVNFGDPGLGKNAIEQFSWSVNSEGFLSARYPTNSTYYIPNYSLYWIGMLYDYMMHVDDPEFIRSKLPVARLVMSYFTGRMRSDATIEKPDYHNFVDWSFPAGEPPFDEHGYSALVDLHFLRALQWSGALEKEYGDRRIYEEYSTLEKKLRNTIRELYYQEEKTLFSDTPQAEHYSVHTNVFAVLTGVVEGKEASELMQNLLKNKSLTQPTIYFQFYVFEALKKAGLGNIYLDNLGIWEEMMAAGVSTWPETGLESRSECHAWGASPNYHFYKIVGGIESAKPGFKSVEIRPAMRELNKLKIIYPHPFGNIELGLNKDGDKIHGLIELPGDLNGYLFLEGTKIKLKAGKNILHVSPDYVNY